MERPRSIVIVATAGFVLGILTISASFITTIWFQGIIVPEFSTAIPGWSFFTLLEAIVAIPLIAGSVMLITGAQHVRIVISMYSVLAGAFYAISLITLVFAQFTYQSYAEFFVKTYFPAYSLPILLLTSRYSIINPTLLLALIVLQQIGFMAFARYMFFYVRRPPVADWLDAARHAHEEKRD